MKDILSSSTSTASSGSGDIISLLSKAQHEYNQGGSNISNQNGGNSNNSSQYAPVQASPSAKQPMNQIRGPIVQQQQPQQQQPQQQQPQQLLLNLQLQPVNVESPLQQQQQQQLPYPLDVTINQVQQATGGPKSISLSSLFANAKSQQQQQQQQKEFCEKMSDEKCSYEFDFLAQNGVSIPSEEVALLTGPPRVAPISGSISSLPKVVPISGSISGPPKVVTAPLTAPILGFPSTSGKPDFVPLDDDEDEEGKQQNALQLFIQKMKIEEDKRNERNQRETIIENKRPLPLRMDGGSGG